MMSKVTRELRLKEILGDFGERCPASAGINKCKHPEVENSLSSRYKKKALKFEINCT